MEREKINLDNSENSPDEKSIYKKEEREILRTRLGLPIDATDQEIKSAKENEDFLYNRDSKE